MQEPNCKLFECMHVIETQYNHILTNAPLLSFKHSCTWSKCRWTVVGDDNNYVHDALSLENTQYKGGHTSPYVSKHATSEFIEKLDWRPRNLPSVLRFVRQIPLLWCHLRTGLRQPVAQTISTTWREKYLNDQHKLKRETLVLSALNEEANTRTISTTWKERYFNSVQSALILLF